MTSTETSAEARGGETPKRRRGITWKRALLPAVVLLVSLFVVAPVAGTLSGKLSSVTENDQAAFLPDSAESTRSLELETRFAGDQDIPALIVWERAGGLTDADISAVADASTRLGAVDGVAAPPSAPIPQRGRPGGPGRGAPAR